MLMKDWEAFVATESDVAVFGVRPGHLTTPGRRLMLILFRTCVAEIRDLQEDGDVNDPERAIATFQELFEARVREIAQTHGQEGPAHRP